MRKSLSSCSSFFLSRFGPDFIRDLHWLKVSALYLLLTCAFGLHYKQETKSTDQFDVRAERMCVCKHARICVKFACVLLLQLFSGPATRDTSVTVSLRLA